MATKAKILPLEDAIDISRRSVWIQLRGMGCCLEVHYAAEQLPFLRFRDLAGVYTLEVRGDYYGQTWRCFDQCPVCEDELSWGDPEKWRFTAEEDD